MIHMDLIKKGSQICIQTRVKRVKYAPQTNGLTCKLFVWV